MKNLLASLMCLVLTAAQCFALKGGPPYPGTTANIVGTYAGVMQGVFDPTNPASSNTLALFSLSIAKSGISSGMVVLFVAGRAFTGTMSAVGNPNTTVLRGVIQTTSLTTLILCSSTGSPLRAEVTDRADGQINANIRQTSRSNFTVAGTLIVGTSLLSATRSDKDPANCQQVAVAASSLSLLVDGFKQSTS